MLDSSGQLHAPSGVPAESRKTLASVLSAHALPMAAAPADLAPVPGSLPPPQDLSPAGIMVLSDTPQLRWPAADGADGYEITIFDSEFKELDASGRTRQTTWTPVRPLPRGALYQWQITIWRDDKQELLPPDSGFKFRVLDAATARRVRAALASNPPEHLLAASLCANAGLRQETREELGALAAANPGSTLVQELMDSVK